MSRHDWTLLMVACASFSSRNLMLPKSHTGKPCKLTAQCFAEALFVALVVASLWKVHARRKSDSCTGRSAAAPLRSVASGSADHFEMTRTCFLALGPGFAEEPAAPAQALHAILRKAP